MPRHWQFIVATAVAATGFAFAGSASAQDTTSGQETQTQTQTETRTYPAQQADRGDRLHTTVDTSTTPGRDDDRATGQEAAAPDAEDIYKTLAQAAEAAVEEGTFDDLVERFVDADRNRIGEANLDEDQYNVASQRFRQTWENRFGSELSIENHEVVFDQQNFRVMQSQIGGEARTVGDRIERAIDRTGDRLSETADRVTGREREAEVEVEADRRATANGETRVEREAEVEVEADAQVAGRSETPEREKIAGGDENREPGREIASVTIPASHGLPQVSVEMIKEFPDSWKIDVPDHLDAQRLHANLQRELDRLADNQAQWPADQVEAQRMVVHAVLLAVMDKDSQASGIPGQDQLRQPGQQDQNQQLNTQQNF